MFPEQGLGKSYISLEEFILILIIVFWLCENVLHYKNKDIHANLNNIEGYNMKSFYPIFCSHILDLIFCILLEIRMYMHV